MKTILHEGSQFVLRFDRGDEIVSLLKDFCQKEKIDSGFFHALGASKNLKLSYYNFQLKKYLEKEFNEDLEIANLVGNICQSDEGLVVHTHGTFSDKEFKAFAGHVVAVEIGVTCEMVLTKFDHSMVRKFNPGVGIKILD